MTAERNYLNYIKASLLSGVILVLLIRCSYAETYYVSPTGSAGWKESVNIETPCSPATAMKNAVAGDTVYFRGGQYDLYHDPNIHESYYWYRGILGPSSSGTVDNPITFAAYPGETPVMNSNGWQRALGNGDKNYIVFDGFVLKAHNGKGMGGLIITDHNIGGRVKGNIVRNCIFDGGTTIDTFTDNREGLRIEGTSYTLIRNCKFYNYRETNNNHNTSAIKTYGNDHLTIENTEIYNCSQGIFLKQDTDDSIIRYNYIHDCYNAFFTHVSTDANSISDRNQVYHNVIANNSGGFSVGYRDGTGDDWEIYNNIIYEGIGCSNGKGWKIWNNIIGGSLGAYGGNTLSECDHNLFVPDNNYIARLHIYEKNDTTYKRMYSWQSSGELEGGGNPGTGSLVADPKFVNYSGKMNQLNDFQLASDSPCRGAGRRGENMGVDITKVGYKGSAGEASADNTLSADFNTGFELEEDETDEMQMIKIPSQNPEAVWLPREIDLNKHTTGPFTVKVRVEGIDEQRYPSILPRIKYYIGTGRSHGYFDMINEGDNIWSFDIPDPKWHSYRSNSLHYYVKVFDEEGGVITESHWQIELIDSFIQD